ncbi:hypothetical protein K456DRAFT_990132 [Colletotrichum gloeosporioides 23]|nr:hypothetical protein K456DRAFT_990132 [Colletotrichum gloeosporioides 23]
MGLTHHGRRRALALRPECTAPVIGLVTLRASLSRGRLPNNLSNNFEHLRRRGLQGTTQVGWQNHTHLGAVGFSRMRWRKKRQNFPSIPWPGPRGWGLFRGDLKLVGSRLVC